MHTRFDVGYLVTEFATTATYVLTEVSEITDAVRMVNRIIASLKTQEAIPTYCRFFPNAQMADTSLLRKIRIFVFTGAGFATLRHARSAEACIIVDGGEISRDGSI